MGKPKIRFKGYEDDWEQRKLGEVAQEFKSGNSLKADEIDITGDYPVYGGNGLRGYTSTYNHDGEYALIGRQGALCGNMNYSVGKAYFTEHAVVVKADENNDARFLYYMLDTMNLGQYSDQSAQPGLAVNKLVKLENQFPMKEEQQRIGWYFSNIDHLITLHQRKCEETKSLKKYMLQKMFPENGNCVPKIRFSGFADAWEQRKWIDVVDISTEMVNPTTGEYDNMPHIAPGNIESFTGRILDNVKTVKEEQLISGKFRFRPDDVVYGKINPQLGKYFYATVNGLTSADAYVFNGKNGLKQKFLFALLQTSDFFKYSVSVSKRSGMPKINRDELNAYSFLMPSEEEQDRIGSYLLQLDHLITLHQRKCYRFIDIALDAWEQRKLSDIYASIGNAFVGTATPYYVESGHFYLESNNIKDGQINHNSEIFINDEFYEKQKDKWLHTGDMVMVQSGHVGHAAVIPEELDNSAAHALIMFRHPKEKIEPYFLNYQYQTNKSKKKIEEITTGNTIKHILASDMQEFVVDITNYDEQKKIGSYFQKLDHLITLHQHKCDELQKLKKFMLQNMFV